MVAADTTLFTPGTNDHYTATLNNGILGSPNADYTLCNGAVAAACDTSAKGVFRFVSTGTTTITISLNNPVDGRTVMLIIVPSTLGATTLVMPSSVLWPGTTPSLVLPTSTITWTKIRLRWDAVVNSGAGNWVVEDYQGMNPGWIAPTMGSNINNLGSGWATAGYYMDKTKRVYLKGVLTGTGLVANATIYQLPVGYRPSESLLFNGASYNGATRGNGDIQIDTSGNIKVNGTPTGTSIFNAMTNVSFIAAA